MGKKLPLVLEKKVAGEKNGTHLLIKTPRVVGGAITLRHYLSHIPANKLASTPTPMPITPGCFLERVSSSPSPPDH